MEKNDHGAANNIPRISSQSEQNEQPEFGFQPDYGGTLFDDTIFQTNHLQGIPLPHIFGRGSKRDFARSSQPHNFGLMDDGENVVGNLSLNYGVEPDPQHILNAESTCPSRVGSITTNFQSCDHRTTTSSSIAMSDPLQSGRPQGPQIGSSLGNIEGSGNARFWSHDHQRLIYRPECLPSLQRNTLQRPQLDGSILSLGINTTDGDPFNGHAGTAMSGNTVMANAMLSNRLSGPLIDGSFLTTGHGGDSDVGFQVNDYSGSGRFLSMQGNMGARNLPRNHGRLMGVTNIGAGLNPFVNLQTPQVQGPYQVAVPSNQFIGLGGVGDVRCTDPRGSFYCNPFSTSIPPISFQPAILNNEQNRWATRSSVVQEPGILSIDLSRSPLHEQQQQQQQRRRRRRRYLHNISGPNANIFAPQIRNPYGTFDPLRGFTASAQEEAGRFGRTDNHHVAPVWSRWRTNNTLQHCTAPPVVGTIGGIAAQSHSGLHGPTNGSSTNWSLNNQSTSSAHQARTPFFLESVANVNHREMLNLADAGGLVHPAKGLRGRAAKSKSIQTATGGKLTVQDNLSIQPTNCHPSQAYEKKEIRIIQPSAKALQVFPEPQLNGHHLSMDLMGPPHPQNKVTTKTTSDGVRPDDYQSSSFQTGEKCYICKRDVDYAPTGTMSRSSGTIPTAVLACKHVFHEECLLSITPREQATDPPCIPCAMGER
ncbi:uncharacterized protein LOC131217058 isoform X3 [Magnolia sinica]|uniref:uncharacterized protein LOC131217058 isoform X3 n=1 Tax=Magnolia sinica TaxID=86752 RepID=UPI002657E0B2|nr:uncharacterized protein LOC131217058 isoform X3 [Magnolia sinica]